MFKKFTTTLAIGLILTAPAYAQERTFVTNPPATSGSGVAYNSGTDTITATAADGARIYSVTKPIERGAKYTYQFTLSGVTAGGVMPYVGTTRETSVAPTVVAPVSAAANPLDPGKVSIADNFTTANGLTSASIPPVQGSGEPGAFRLFCTAGQVKSDDPLVVANMPGAAHMHQFFGNTGANAYSTYKSLRASGGSTCGSDQANPLNRSAYWYPAMLNGRGGIVSPSHINVYYKRHPLSDIECTAAEGVRRGICVRLPNGLTMIWGYNMTTMASTPTGITRWVCRNKLGAAPVGDGTGGGVGPSSSGQYYNNLQDLRTAGVCPVGAQIVIITQAPECWDGVNLGTPNHRNHVSHFVADKCPASHPYYFSEILLQIAFDVDATLNDLRLSSDDQMGMGSPAGSTFHTDYMEAWSTAFKDQWQNGCIDGDRSCSQGADGLGAAIKGAGNFSQPSRVVPMSRQGLGRKRSVNGTFRGEFTAPADGEFGLNFLLFTGTVTGFKVTKITKGARGPVTQPVTQ